MRSAVIVHVLYCFFRRCVTARQTFFTCRPGRRGYAICHFLDNEPDVVCDIEYAIRDVEVARRQSALQGTA
jgi:hypothetical protein